MLKPKSAQPVASNANYSAIVTASPFFNEINLLANVFLVELNTAYKNIKPNHPDKPKNSPIRVILGGSAAYKIISAYNKNKTCPPIHDYDFYEMHSYKDEFQKKAYEDLKESASYEIAANLRTKGWEVLFTHTAENRFLNGRYKGHDFNALVKKDISDKLPYEVFSNFQVGVCPETGELIFDKSLDRYKDENRHQNDFEDFLKRGKIISYHLDDIFNQARSKLKDGVNNNNSGKLSIEDVNISKLAFILKSYLDPIAEGKKFSLETACVLKGLLEDKELIPLVIKKMSELYAKGPKSKNVKFADDQAIQTYIAGLKHNVNQTVSWAHETKKEMEIELRKKEMHIRDVRDLNTKLLDAIRETRAAEVSARNEKVNLERDNKALTEALATANSNKKSVANDKVLELKRTEGAVNTLKSDNLELTQELARARFANNKLQETNDLLDASLSEQAKIIESNSQKLQDAFKIIAAQQAEIEKLKAAESKPVVEEQVEVSKPVSPNTVVEESEDKVESQEEEAQIPTKKKKNKPKKKVAVAPADDLNSIPRSTPNPIDQSLPVKCPVKQDATVNPVTASEWGTNLTSKEKSARGLSEQLVSSWKFIVSSLSFVVSSPAFVVNNDLQKKTVSELNLATKDLVKSLSDLVEDSQDKKASPQDQFKQGLATYFNLIDSLESCGDANGQAFYIHDLLGTYLSTLLVEIVINAKDSKNIDVKLTQYLCHDDIKTDCFNSFIPKEHQQNKAFRVECFVTLLDCMIERLNKRVCKNNQIPQEEFLKAKQISLLRLSILKKHLSDYCSMVASSSGSPFLTMFSTNSGVIRVDPTNKLPPGMVKITKN